MLLAKNDFGHEGCSHGEFRISKYDRRSTAVISAGDVRSRSPLILFARTEDDALESLSEFERHDVIEDRIYDRADVIQETGYVVEDVGERIEEWGRPAMSAGM